MIPPLLLWGLFGGFVAEFAGWYQLSRLDPKDKAVKARRARLRSPEYLITTAGMILIGVGFVLVYMQLPDVKLNPILAMNIGASAPLLAQSLGRDFPVELPKID